jgi:hypothetical protein
MFLEFEDAVAESAGRVEDTVAKLEASVAEGDAYLRLQHHRTVEPCIPALNRPRFAGTHPADLALLVLRFLASISQLSSTVYHFPLLAT